MVFGGGEKKIGMTITEKILAKHAGKKRVEPGEIVNARPDFVLANDNMGDLAIEAGAKNGIFHVDQKTLAFLRARVRGDYEIVSSDREAHYGSVLGYDVSQIFHQGAVPFSPGNVKTVSEVGPIPKRGVSESYSS